mgnify:CR=1 FL=1
MAYDIRYTDPNKGTITVEDQSINEETTIGFPGRRSLEYGTVVSENFLRLLENFANNSEPERPVEGQLWYDTTDGVNQLKIYDGTTWAAAGGLKKSAAEPEVANSLPGDLWVNTTSQQLFLFTGSSWILVGPTFSGGAQTGLETETIIGIDNAEYSVLTMRVNNNPVAIVSARAFIPKTAIAGFRAGINRGITLSTDTFDGGILKYWGTSERAENLVVAGDSVPAANFLRSDQVSTTNFNLRVKSNNGIDIGSSGQLSINLSNEVGVIQHNTAGSKIDFRLRRGNRTQTILAVDSEGLVGINTSAPDEALDVRGNTRIAPLVDDPESGILTVESTFNSVNIDTGAIVSRGGLGVALDTHIGGTLTVEGTSFLSDVLPDATAARNIGSSTTRFNQVHATTFFGNLQGNVSGTVSGRAGSADRLTSPTTFSLTGDVSANSIQFDGQVGGATKTFNTSISNSFIANKPSVTTAASGDEIIINVISGQTGLYRISKNDFLKSVPRTPVGTVVQYAGEVAPPGWLFCTGDEIRKSSYTLLWETIGHRFRDPLLISDGGVNFFALPDFRGRLPLGVDNMGGTSADRVTDEAADIVGGTGGSSEKTIDVENLPDHEHTNRGESGTQYYSIRTAAGTPVDDEAIELTLSPGSGGTHGLPSSGGIRASSTGQPFDVMNPFLAMNYIIYTGQ